MRAAKLHKGALELLEQLRIAESWEKLYQNQQDAHRRKHGSTNPQLALQTLGAERKVKMLRRSYNNIVNQLTTIS